MTDDPSSSITDEAPDAWSSSPSLDVSVAAGDWERVLPDPMARAQSAIDAAIRALTGPATRFVFDHAEISVVLDDNEHVRSLNRNWRGIDKPTNVLSFPGVEPEALPDALRPGAPPCLLGDIIMAYGVVADEAAAQSKAFSHHFAHLLIHGFYHLIGFDHIDDDEAAVMEAHEVAALRGLGIADPYGEQTPEVAP